MRLADSHGHDEDHWPLGQGRVDFRHLFHRLEQHSQFHGHSMCAFGSPEVLLEGRAYLAQEAAAALR